MNKLGKGPLVDATCKISNVWAFWFQRRRCLNKLLTHARTHARTDDGRRTNWYHKSSPWHFVPGELKNQMNTYINYLPLTTDLKNQNLNHKCTVLWLQVNTQSFKIYLVVSSRCTIIQMKYSDVGSQCKVQTRAPHAEDNARLLSLNAVKGHGFV